jgi:uncharacterized protein YjbJ (UPF0337 family)
LKLSTNTTGKQIMNQQTLQGNWNEIKGKIRSKWGTLTDDDLMAFSGNVQQLVGTIQKKTGEARENIEQFFDQLGDEGRSAFSQAGQAARAGVQQVADTFQETTHRVADSAKKGYADVESAVRRSPAESLAICFGAGIVTGVLVTLLMRKR